MRAQPTRREEAARHPADAEAHGVGGSEEGAARRQGKSDAAKLDAEGGGGTVRGATSRGAVGGVARGGRHGAGFGTRHRRRASRRLQPGRSGTHLHHQHHRRRHCHHQHHHRRRHHHHRHRHHQRRQRPPNHRRTAAHIVSVTGFLGGQHHLPVVLVSDGICPLPAGCGPKTISAYSSGPGERGWRCFSAVRFLGFLNFKIPLRVASQANTTTHAPRGNHPSRPPR